MTTITGQSKLPKGVRRGFTLVEIMITMMILSMIIAVGLSAITFISQSSTALTNYTLMSKDGRNALEILARDLRMGIQIYEATPGKLDFMIHGKAGSTNNVVYEYDGEDEALYRSVDGGAKEEIISDLSNLKFNYFDLRREATEAPISIKEVQIQGILERKALAISTTNHIISARYMMRNRRVSN